MAVRMFPSGSTRVDVVCATDDAIFNANSPDTLRAYLRSGDLAALAVPESATRFTISPPGASAVELALIEAGQRPGEEADRAARDGWSMRWMRAIARYGLRAVSAFPGIEAVKIDGVLRYPEEYFERIPPQIRTEVAGHIHRIAFLGDEGKAPSAGPSGGP